MPFQASDHTFVVCAYKESEYLEDCIKSLLQQTLPTNVLISTSTPNDFIKRVAEMYDIPLNINDKVSGLASDWNFAIDSANTPLITLCHQDDYYYANYSEEILKNVNMCSDFLMAYTNYEEDKNGVLEHDNINLKIKNILNFPMKYKRFWKSKWIRRRVISLGNPICCPSVTLNKENINMPVFDCDYKNAADWDAWERISKLEGCVVYCRKYLMAHRIHEDSTTTLNIKNDIRTREDFLLFNRFWPSPIAKVLTRVFKLSEKNNGV